MPRRDKVDQARAEMLKTVRTAIRLKHSLAADRELNDVLPEAERKFNAAVMKGELPGPLDVKALLNLE
jgi:hypothetical protein